MKWEAISAIISALALACTIGCFVFALGKRDGIIAGLAKKVEDLELCMVNLATKEQLQGVVARACEDRLHDDKRIEELFNSRNETREGLIELTASMQAVCDRLGKIEPKLDELLKRGMKV